MGRIKKREFKTVEDREKAIKPAIVMASAVDKNGKRKVSIWPAAEAHGIPFSTLQERLSGVKTQVQSHIHQQLLSPTDERAILCCILG